LILSILTFSTYQTGPFYGFTTCRGKIVGDLINFWMLAHPHHQYRGLDHYGQLVDHSDSIVFLYMNSTIDRFLLIIEYENIKMPWLEEITGIEVTRWRNIKKRGVMRTSELDAFNKAYPEYSVWLATGLEIPQEGYVSPMTKRGAKEKKAKS
jgi:hypothetical protein